MPNITEKKQSSRQGNFVFSRRVLGIDNFGQKLLILAGMAVMFAVLSLTGIGCVWRYVLHISCPGCGMTRAWLALLRGDVTGAFEWHFMFPSVPVLGVYFLYYERLFASKWKTVHKIVLGIILAGFLIRWIWQPIGADV